VASLKKAPGVVCERNMGFRGTAGALMTSLLLLVATMVRVSESESEPSRERLRATRPARFNSSAVGTAR